MKPLPLPHPAQVAPERVAALLAPPPADALAGGFGEDVLSLAEPADQDSRMPSLWISALSSSIVRRTKAA
jgi:hypothetical protein